MKASHELSAHCHSVTPDKISALHLCTNSIRFTELCEDCEDAVLNLLGLR